MWVSKEINGLVLFINTDFKNLKDGSKLRYLL